MNPLYQKHIISINDLSREELELVLETAAKLKANPQPELLKHKVIASCFFEASTRTRLSFETSMHRLGASVVGFSDSSNTSLGKKGETLADTISVISTYVDAIVMRHPQEGAARLATEFSGGIPVLNAGDGANQHPTQTLLDLFTIQETQGTLENLNIAMVGDLKYGRTVHSLTQALAKFNGNRFFFIAPDALAMPQYILDMLDEKGIRQQPVSAGVFLQPVLQRHLGAQFAVKGCQHRQAAAAKQLGLIGDGEKLEKGFGGAKFVHAGNLIKPLHHYPLARRADSPHSSS